MTQTVQTTVPNTLQTGRAIRLYGGGEEWLDYITDLHQVPDGWTKAVAVVQKIFARLTELPGSVLRTTANETALMARLFTRNSEMIATYSPQHRKAISYPLAGPASSPVFTANQLIERGLLSKRFFNRLHLCTACKGHRLNVREECVHCRSANVHEQTIVHHYRCGHQGLEMAFMTPNGMRCPKCGDPVRHIGLDYDRPGLAVVCHDCNSKNDVAAVGFECMDCQSHYTSEQITTCDYYHYALTPLAIDKLLHDQNGEAGVPAAPESFRSLLRQAMIDQAEFREPYVVARIENVDTTLRENSPLVWARTQTLLHDCIHSATRPTDAACAFQDGFLLLLRRCDGKAARKTYREIDARAREVLKYAPKLQVTELDTAAQTLLLNQ